MPHIDVTQMSFTKLYSLLVSKAEKKGRTRQEVDQVTAWLTGYTPEDLARLEQSEISYADFFQNAPAMNPNRALITGRVCGVRVEEVSASTGGVSSQKSPLLSSLTSPLQQPESESASVSAHKSAERRRFTARPP